MPGKYWWIKERYNPQLGSSFKAMGKITVKEAKTIKDRPIYGAHYMRRYSTEAEYNTELAFLKKLGRRVQ